MARPTSLNPYIVAPLLEELLREGDMAKACAVAGIPERTVRSWLTIGEDPKRTMHAWFRESVETAKEAGAIAKMDAQLKVAGFNVVRPETTDGVTANAALV